MSREIPYSKENICDNCGQKGAYDFYGDYFCPQCCDKFFKESKEE